MSQFICSQCKGEFHSSEDHYCTKLTQWVDSPERRELDASIETETRELAKRFPMQK